MSSVGEEFCKLIPWAEKDVCPKGGFQKGTLQFPVDTDAQTHDFPFLF